MNAQTKIKPSVTKVDMASFGKPGVQCLGYNTPILGVPAANDTYKFRDDVLRVIIGYLNSPAGDGLALIGPTGSGKTTAILEAAARLNWPVQSITASGRTEALDLIGTFVLMASNPGEQPSMRWMDGPLAKAMKQGHILVINEFDLIDPAELSALNDVIEGRPLVISQNGGQIVKPHPMFRIVVTGNTAGTGDETGMYPGTVRQNIAGMDRYRSWLFDYPTIEEMLEILTATVPQIPKEFGEKMALVANKLQGAFKSGELGCTMSVRCLNRWARLTCDYRGAPNALKFGLEIALLNKIRQEDKEAVGQICLSAFGSEWEK